MSKTSTSSHELTIDQVELKGFSRSVAELEWLLLILVLLYFSIPGMRIADRGSVIVSMVAFAVFIITFRYLNFHRQETRWKLAIETWVMTAFIAWVLWNTGRTESPLLNLYLLVIITSGLTLGKVTTMLEFLLITACYIYMGVPEYDLSLLSLTGFTDLMTRFAPFLLVAYLITMLSADLQFARRAFKDLSEHDELTCLLNRRAFMKILIRESGKASRYERPYSVLMIDADGLKGINDKLGHEAGNRLIQLVASTIRDSLRGSDVLARYGGDEFIALLPETAPQQAWDAAERVRTAILNTTANVDGKRITSTASIGIASFPEHGNDAQHLVELADKAMYESKIAGRNRTTLPSPRRGAEIAVSALGIK